MSARMTRRSALLTLSLAAAAGPALVAAPASAAPRARRRLTRGARGADVAEVQVRVAGWAADSAEQTFLAVDGEFGADTKAAVTRFQEAYDLSPTGEVDGPTQDALDALTASDGSTAHFGFDEFHSKDGAEFGEGNVGTSDVKENVRRLMYKLEAIRTKSGDAPVTINSGFRSLSHNENVGGATNSQHTYGIAADIVVSGQSVDDVIGHAQTSGLSGIIRYDTFTHVDSRMQYPYGANYWHWDV